jgi:hypothetical protein
MFGRERILLCRRGTLVFEKDLFGLGSNREFDLAYISNLRMAANLDCSSSAVFWGIAGTVAFDYGAKTFRFAAFDEAEASHIITQLKARHDFK